MEVGKPAACFRGSDAAGGGLARAGGADVAGAGFRRSRTTRRSMGFPARSRPRRRVVASLATFSAAAAGSGTGEASVVESRRHIAVLQAQAGGQAAVADAEQLEADGLAPCIIGKSRSGASAVAASSSRAWLTQAPSEQLSPLQRTSRRPGGGGSPAEAAFPDRTGPRARGPSPAQIHDPRLVELRRNSMGQG